VAAGSVAHRLSTVRDADRIVVISAFVAPPPTGESAESVAAPSA
jgi:hypothetical protein